MERGRGDFYSTANKQGVKMLVYGKESDSIQNDYPKKFYDIFRKMGWYHFMQHYKKYPPKRIELSRWHLEEKSLIIELRVEDRGEGVIKLRVDEHKKNWYYPDETFPPRYIAGTIFTGFEDPIKVIVRMIKNGLDKDQIPSNRKLILFLKKQIDKTSKETR